MKKLIFLLFVICSILPQVLADDQIRTAQQYLKDQGFYTGEVDGAASSETASAIKRFQIRNGLEVTGQLNQETLSAMQPVSQPSAPAPAVEEVRPQVPAPEVPRDPAYKNQPTANPTPDVAVRPAVVGDYSVIFRGTPYQNAPGAVQFETLRRAQLKMERQGYYRGQPDGRPGPGTTQAIVRYQVEAGLQRTGRLDMDTLADMNLLPHRGADRPYNYPEPVPDRPVYRGIWVH